MVEELERHEWIKNYLRRKAGTHDVNLEYSMDNEMGRKFNIGLDDSEVSLRNKNADRCQRKQMYYSQCHRRDKN